MSAQRRSYSDTPPRAEISTHPPQLCGPSEWISNCLPQPIILISDLKGITACKQKDQIYCAAHHSERSLEILSAWENWVTPYNLFSVLLLHFVLFYISKIHNLLLTAVTNQMNFEGIVHDNQQNFIRKYFLWAGNPFKNIIIKKENEHCYVRPSKSNGSL